MESFSVKTSRREQMVDITSQVREIVSSKGMGKGMVTVFVPHTTAAVTINEGADPSVQHDLLAGLAELVPHRTPYYQHSEGNSDAHIKASLLGSTVNVLVDGGRLILGTWQAIFFCEFDGPRTRQIHVYVTN
ncbi:MAG: YjbQ family protein [Syntrophomonadaceae bacterium]|jgi:secondary thiamine-phosphate synthase enzyme|nr:YjbQ family protein [Syntrophomonadaceae bacterium]